MNLYRNSIPIELKLKNRAKEPWKRFLNWIAQNHLTSRPHRSLAWTELVEHQCHADADDDSNNMYTSRSSN